MRRKEANLGMKILSPRVMSALQVWLWLLLFIFQNEFCVSKSAEPGIVVALRLCCPIQGSNLFIRYLDFDNLPETNFSCAGKVIGGYYADLETDCQMFHVCTIGQLEEPMDIKFLCLNGTVFDQETRVCERVDEVDCSKSEHFYSLNLELYGNTAPPIIKADTSSHHDADEEDGEEDEEYDLEEMYDETSTTPKSTTVITTTTTTTTKRPITTTTPRVYHTTSKTSYYHTTVQSYHGTSDTEDDAYDLIDDNDNNDTPKKNSSTVSGHHFQHFNTDSQLQRPQSNLAAQKNKFKDYDVTSTGEDNSKSTNGDDNSQLFSPQDFIYHHNKQNDASRKTPAISFQQQSFSSDGQNSHVTVTTHTGHGTYNADGIKSANNANENSPINRAYLTSSTPQTDTKKYEKPPAFNTFQPFNSPKRTPLIPTPNTHGNVPTGHHGLSSPKQQNEPLYFSFRKPQSPQGFKSSQSSSSSPNQNQKQISKVPAKTFQNYQPSEKHEISIESEYDFEKLTPTYPFIHQDFSQYHYEHKRSQEPEKYDDKTLSEKTAETTTITSTPYYNTWATRNNNYTKSLPRVIVTASASVSDSNGKKLNYTVGNIVHAVKPLVPTNYDNYKESDVLLDPFFLDVPKLARNRSKRSNKNRSNDRISRQTIFEINNDENRQSNKTTSTTTLSTDLEDPISVDLTPTKTSIIKEVRNDNTVNLIKNTSVITTTPWIPPDYVDDNYEPLTYQDNASPENTDIEDSPIDDSTEKNTVKPFLGFPVLGISGSDSEMKHTVIKSSTAQSPVPATESQDVKKIAIILNDNIKHTGIITTESITKPKTFVPTTENSSAKTTLDVATIESTTISFVDSKINAHNATQGLKKYNLTSVNLVTMSEKNVTTVRFSCKGKKYYKFYPDKTDCRTFHFCSPGFSPRQVLDMVFSCDLGTFFNHNAVSCTHEKPNDCEN